MVLFKNRFTSRLFLSSKEEDKVQEIRSKDFQLAGQLQFLGIPKNNQFFTKAQIEAMKLTTSKEKFVEKSQSQ